MRVGFIGLGNMGLPMAANVLKAGHSLWVWNRSREKIAALCAQGAREAASPAALVQEVEVALVCLASVAASRAMFLGADGQPGLIASAAPGVILVDHATVDLATSRTCAAAAAARGLRFMDAPISGGPLGARDATLSIMAGGDAGAFARARPVLQAMGKTIVHLGPAGAGTAAKLVNQLLVGVQTLAACEALTLARRAGADLEKLVPLLSQSWGQSRMLERNAPEILARRFEPSAVPLRNLVKDLEIITALGAEQGLDLAAAEAALDAFRALEAAGRGACDIASACLRVERES